MCLRAMKASVQMPLSGVMREPEGAAPHAKGKDTQDLTLLRLFLLLQVMIMFYSIPNRLYHSSSYYYYSLSH